MRLHTLKGNTSIGTAEHSWSLALNPVGQGCLWPDASQVYRAGFDNGSRLLIDADLRRGS